MFLLFQDIKYKLLVVTAAAKYHMSCVCVFFFFYNEYELKRKQKVKFFFQKRKTVSHH